ncbi:hypothetical protein E2C01_063713 [Portunus trituberculatus]|uniref:Uncharacterized protein n=1 Tax=Portunus trituberculatus TaxID=210409 RepID=A0A5B7HJS2_PORTR|nr:hypothetical protein [Portunus trituberculatus]
MILRFKVVTPKMRLGGDMDPKMGTTINKIAYASSCVHYHPHATITAITTAITTTTTITTSTTSPRPHRSAVTTIGMCTEIRYTEIPIF